MSSGWLLLVIPGLIWGASFLFIAQGLRALEPNAITFLRIAIGFLTLGCFPGARKPVARADWPAVAWLGLLWFAFPLSMFPFAEQRVSSALTGMLNGANPLFATLVASLIARQAPSAGVAVGLGIGIGGTVLMGLPALNEGRSSTEGVMMIMAAMVSYGVALSIARSLQQKYGAMPVIWRAQAVGLLLTAPLGIPDLMKIKWLPVPLASVVALGAFGTAIANVLMASAAGRFGAAKASGTTFLIPVVSLILGVAILGEKVVPLSLIGGVVCLAGAGLMKRAASH
ncbi:MAG: DMT family transporter [Acidobacteria bacterium]|nr:DMT family transporter [Acidobacteriota bacterium]